MKTLLVALALLASTAFAQTQPTLPAAAQCYFTSVEKKDLNAFAACFAPNAFIIDVSRRIAGVPAIRTWANNEVMAGKYTLLEVTPTDKGVSILLRFAPSGVGEGFRARYDIDIANGRIVSMNLQYA